jgi:hypothetical protein
VRASVFGEGEVRSRQCGVGCAPGQGQDKNSVGGED